MNSSLTDNELLNELKLRFEKNEQTLKEQTELATELREVNNRLIASENLKSNFLSNIRNEINNPIASVLELAKSISEENLSGDTIKKFAKLIYNETFSLDFQLRNIFASAEIEAGETNLSVSGVNVASIIENVIESLKHQTLKKQIQLETKINIPADYVFHSDSEKLHLILLNLYANAVQFSNNQGRINISATINEGALDFKITDNGAGISEESKKIIFDRFRQAEEGSIKSYAGHGLGLSIVKALIDLFDGELSLDTEINVGSSFRILIQSMELPDEGADIFSANGNDFLFGDNESKSF